MHVQGEEEEEEEEKREEMHRAKARQMYEACMFTIIVVNGCSVMIALRTRIEACLLLRVCHGS